MVVLIISLIGTSYYYHNQSEISKTEIRSLGRELSTKTNDVKRYKDKDSINVVAIQKYTSTIDKLKVSNDSIEKKLYKKSKASDLEVKQLQEALYAQVHTESSGDTSTMVIYKTDTINSIDSLKINDGFLELIATTTDYHYTYDIEIYGIKAVELVDRNFFLWRWLKWKKLSYDEFIELSTNNPDSKINGMLIKLGDNEVR